MNSTTGTPPSSEAPPTNLTLEQTPPHEQHHTLSQTPPTSEILPAAITVGASPSETTFDASFFFSRTIFNL